MSDFITKDFGEVSTLCVFSARPTHRLIVTPEQEKSHGIIVLPPGAHGRIGDDALRRWLSRGRVTFAEPESDILLKVLALLAVPAPVDGLAALRFWGQTGERSGAWIAAADPVHLETRLHTLRLRSLRADELPGPELRVLFDHLQATLGDGTDISLTKLGHFGYLRCNDAIATAPMSAAVLHGLPPDEYVPDGESASVYHQLLGEIQMALHDHAINQQRAAAGQPEINSLWLWGGGVAPEAESRALPLLIADDVLFRGYWHSCEADGMDWCSDFDKTTKNFVAVLPDLPADDAELAMLDCLNRTKRMLTRGALKSVTLLFRDGLSAQVKRWDATRLWRGESPLLQKN